MHVPQFAYAVVSYRGIRYNKRVVCELIADLFVHCLIYYISSNISAEKRNASRELKEDVVSTGFPNCFLH